MRVAPSAFSASATRGRAVASVENTIVHATGRVSHARQRSCQPSRCHPTAAARWTSVRARQSCGRPHRARRRRAGDHEPPRPHAPPDDSRTCRVDVEQPAVASDADARHHRRETSAEQRLEHAGARLLHRAPDGMSAAGHPPCDAAVQAANRTSRRRRSDWRPRRPCLMPPRTSYSPPAGTHDHRQRRIVGDPQPFNLVLLDAATLSAASISFRRRADGQRRRPDRADAADDGVPRRIFEQLTAEFDSERSRLCGHAV